MYRVLYRIPGTDTVPLATIATVLCLALTLTMFHTIIYINQLVSRRPLTLTFINTSTEYETPPTAEFYVYKRHNLLPTVSGTLVFKFKLVRQAESTV